MAPCRTAMGPEAAVVIGHNVAMSIGAHELAVHDGEKCWNGRVELVAFIAHTMGLRPKDFEKVAQRLEEHFKECECPPREKPPEGW